ncbi:uncharacterized protein TNCV_245041 [Trichonephila clavipes]|uniref:Uncharacterized protein n=1 Tax=Trichonephila clavipes TaxID=2585209 RepID=A0A8X6RXD1_TRICX|nr:uncharacterized protein TNCV_245041 [Trichonephila clavipes]
MMEAGWSARRVPRQLGRSDCVVRRCWEQWIREMLFTRRLGSGCPRMTNRREDCARVEPTASSAAIQAQIAPSLRPLCLLEPYEGARLKDIWDRGAHYVCCP